MTNKGQERQKLRKLLEDGAASPPIAVANAAWFDSLCLRAQRENEMTRVRKAFIR